MLGKKPSGPERPEDVEKPPVIYKESGLNGSSSLPIWVIVLVGVVIVLMLLLALVFCLVGGIKNHQPRYFLLMINLIVSTLITGLLIFWYFRGVLVSGMLWYIFVQCVFLLFQCITTDIFSFYESTTIKKPWNQIHNGHNCINGSNVSNGFHVSKNLCNVTNSSATLQHFLNHSNKSLGI